MFYHYVVVLKTSKAISHLWFGSLDPENGEKKLGSSPFHVHRVITYKPRDVNIKVIKMLQEQIL